jgi:hypothetical protein
MEDFTLPSVGTRFKKWNCCRSILPKCQIYPQTSLEKKIKKLKATGGKLAGGVACSLSGCGWRVAWPWLSSIVGSVQGVTSGQTTMTGQPPWFFPYTGARFFPLAKFSFFFLPTFFGTCSQLLLVGSSTCMPYPKFFKIFISPSRGVHSL